MVWTEEADRAISKVPFFVRRRVRKRVEEEAGRRGAEAVTMEHVDACRKQFLNNMESEVKGFQLETCFGQGGCPNRAAESDRLATRLEELLSRRNIKGFLKERVKGPLKMHHEFRVTISDCPNACSRPQIVDVGIIGARKPGVSDEPCTGCGACLEICQENAITLSEKGGQPEIASARCVTCGKCLDVCPSGSLVEDKKGFRVLVGGKLGRHPQLGREIAGLHGEDEVLALVERCLDLFFEHNRGGERFGEIVNRVGFESSSV